MRWTRQLIPTLRDAPQDAEIPSHKLMLRAGLIRKLGGGLYTFLPLGLRALQKVEAIVREEMNRASALEILMPALHPREIWERTGRYETLKDVMFNIKDRQERALVLGPTHEEIVTDLVAHEINSYRQLPINLYQIQTKYRDEIRPRFGLMRAKEFVMKDAYSFDTDSEAADASYRAMYEAYQRIFDRCGLRTKIVEADTGAMGGNSSHEFMVLADAGEDGIVECDQCAYAANLERAESRRLDSVLFEDPCPAVEEVETPQQRTIEEVAAYLEIEPARLIKTLIHLADGNPVAILIPGDRQANEIKIRRALGVSELVPADDAAVEQATGAPVGFAGPIGLSIPVWADEKLKGLRGGATGANKVDTHLLHVDLDRDATITQWGDLSMARKADGCPRCDAGRLLEKRGIEVGHVFKLGTKYSQLLGAEYLDAEGKSHPCVMGCYGIGVTRTLQAVIEQRYDENGIVWPLAIAPYTVEIVIVNTTHPQSVEIAESLYAGLQEAGVDCLLDDRDDRPGVKFKDADLLGLPVRINIGERSLANGEIEIKLRGDQSLLKIPADQALQKTLEAIASLRG